MNPSESSRLAYHQEELMGGDGGVKMVETRTIPIYNRAQFLFSVNHLNLLAFEVLTEARLIILLNIIILIPNIEFYKLATGSSATAYDVFVCVVRIES